MQLSDSETHLLILRLIPLVEKRAESKTIFFKTHEGPILPSSTITAYSYHSQSPLTITLKDMHCQLSPSPKSENWFREEACNHFDTGRD